MPTQPQSVDDDVNQTTCYFRQGGQITDNIDITYLRNRKRVWGLTAEARIIDRAVHRYEESNVNFLKLLQTW